MSSRRSARVGVALLLGTLAVAAGCGPAKDAPVAIRGTVKFQGQPVTEGVVQFSSRTTGHGAEITLQPDGTFTAALPAGDYAVVILPPILVTDGKNAPVDMKFKKVRNIPAKYHSTETSGLTAAVRPDKVVHDFDMSP